MLCRPGTTTDQRPGRRFHPTQVQPQAFGRFQYPTPPLAVFAEDIVGHYQKFLDHRRSHRPEDEYTDVTPKEWGELEEHFDKRKVELGNCARPYGTPCQHEHACIRCPMLQINPKMLPCLDELEKDLVMRRKRAEEEQRLGEIEGIDLTLTFLRTKQADAIHSRRRTTVDLDFPRPRG